MKAIHVGLLGLGTVGAGVAKILESHREELEEKIGAPIVLRAIAGNSDTAERAAGVGGVIGGAKGAGSGLRERDRVVKNCLRGRGYRVLN